MNDRPRLLFTMGDVAGIGPEILARAWPELQGMCRPVLVGDPGWMTSALESIGSPARVKLMANGEEGSSPDSVACIAGSRQRLADVVPGHVHAAAGKAAYDFLCTAIDLVMAGRADGIVTAPLHKEGLRAAGLSYPGHTEILAERTGTPQFGMVLYTRNEHELKNGLAVVHVTLHMSLREVFAHISQDAIYEKIRLLDGLLRRLQGRPGRIGVAALNPHASDGGLFGAEEAGLIQPAVEQARRAGFDVSGPWPSDTLFVRARQGEFDGIVAMYHDQGHIALKLLGGRHAVNISVGLPLVRTSVAHGTAYDIAGKGSADAGSLVEAARIAVRLIHSA